MKSKRVQALILAAAVVAGYSGAAAYSAWGMPSVAVADGYGPDDGLTRYVLTADSGDASPDLLAALETVDGVVSAQRLSDGRALVATDGMAPQQLEALPGVTDAEFSTTVPVAGAITDPYYPYYGYNLDNTGTNAYRTPVADADADAPEGWEGGTGNGRIVAVVDTGYDSDHPELAGALWTNPLEACGTVDTDGNGKAGDCHGWNFATNSSDVDNGSYGTHGTSVSGVIGGRLGNGLGTAGIAPDVTIMPLVIGSGSSVDVNVGAEAIRYAVDNGADVINASWGGAFSGPSLTTLRSAIAYAAANDVLVVAAAGNDGADRDTSIMYPASLTEPNIVTVGNSTAADSISASSAYGATSVDLFAPGDYVFTTWNDGDFRLVSGTSIAAPQVAAAYALYRAAWPDATAAELKQALLDDVDPVTAFAGKSVTGGRLSVASLADGALGAVRYTFTSMNSPAPGVVTPGITATGDDATGDYTVTVGLGMETGGEVWAVSGQDITVGGTTLTTDDTGEAVFDLGTANALADLALSPTMDLTDGRYVLTVQLQRDGLVLGRTFAAPLRIGTAANVPATPGGGSGTGTSPGTGTGTTPGTGTGGSGTGTGTGTGTGGSGTGGSGTGTGTSPGTGTGTSPGTGSGTTPGTGTGTTPGTGTGTGTTPGTGTGTGTGDSGTGTGTGTGTGGSGTGSGTGTGGSGTGTGGSGTGTGGTGTGTGGSGTGTGTGGSGTGSGTTPGTGTGTPAPGTGGGSASFPGVGPFGITSMSPTTVPSAGGTVVTITGTALPVGARVLIGSSAAATVVRSTTTVLTFRTPARADGVYDVHVFAPDGRESILASALTFVTDSGTGGSGTGTGTGGSGTGTGTGTGTGGSGTGGSGTGGSGTGGSGTGGSGGSGTAAGPVVVTGPGGQRLVRTSKFAALGSIWSVDCSTSCSGVAI